MINHLINHIKEDINNIAIFANYSYKFRLHFNLNGTNYTIIHDPYHEYHVQTWIELYMQHFTLHVGLRPFVMDDYYDRLNFDVQKYSNTLYYTNINGHFTMELD